MVDFCLISISKPVRRFEPLSPQAGTKWATSILKFLSPRKISQIIGKSFSFSWDIPSARLDAERQKTST
jgi:hypothetical protein